MSDDDLKRIGGAATTPPPAGEEDLYSASTKVGQASAELLALVRAAEEGALKPAPISEKPAPISASEDAKLTAMKEAAARSAKQAVANEVARDAKKVAASVPPGAAAPTPAVPAAAVPAAAVPVSAVAASAAPPAVVPPQARVPAAQPEATPVRRPAETTSKRSSATMRSDDTRPAAGLPPVVGILVMFLAATLVLAALVR